MYVGMWVGGQGISEHHHTHDEGMAVVPCGVDRSMHQATNHSSPISNPPPTPCAKQEALKELGEWASRYEMIAAMGYLALLLMVGKAVNNLGKAVKVSNIWDGV